MRHTLCGKHKFKFDDISNNNKSITKTIKHLCKMCPELLGDNLFDYISSKLFYSAYTM